MRASTRLIVQLLCLSLIVSSCSLWAAEQSRSEGLHWLTDEHCEGLALASPSGMPMDQLVLEGWPGLPDEDWGVVAAQVITGDESRSDERLVAMVADWLTPAALLVPVHPSADPEGGAVEVRFGQHDDDGAHWCDQTHALTIEPLPPADAGQGIEAQLAEAAEQLDDVAELLGTTGPELAALDSSEVSAELLALYISARLIHDDDGIRRIVDSLDEAERDLADRLAAQARRSATIDPGSFEAISPPVPVTAEDPTATHEPEGASHRPSPPPTEPAVSVATASVRNVQSPMVLTAPHAAPPAVQLTAGAAGGCTQTSFSGLAALLGMQLSGDAMTGAASQPSVQIATFVAGLPLTGRVGLTISLMAWVNKARGEYLANMLPSQWQGSFFDYEPELWEDEPTPASHDKFTMRFTSTGWHAGPILAELAMIAGQQGLNWSMKRSLYTARGFDPTSGGNDALTRGVLQALADLSIEMPNWMAVELTQKLMELAGQEPTLGLDGYDPRCWDAENEYPSLEPSLERTWLEAIGPSGWEGENWYEAAELGVGTIQMIWTAPIGQHLPSYLVASDRARSMTGKFTSTTDVNILPIRVEWTPARQRVSPGDVVSLTVTASNAHDPSLWVNDSLGHLDVEVTGEASEVTYQVPADWDEKSPIELTATSLSMHGLRDWTHPAYRGEVTGTAWLHGEDDCDLPPGGDGCIDFRDDDRRCLDCARSVGDPHLTTIDGTRYPFQGAGEYVLLRSLDGAVEIQARQEPWHSHPVSENTAAAVRTGDQRVGFYLTDDGAFQILVDDEEVDISRLAEPRTLRDGSQLWREDEMFGVTLSDSTRMYVIPRATLSIFVEPSPQLADNAAGLLATVEGDGLEVPALPDSTRLPKPEDTDEHFEFLYRRLGDSWRVTNASTLFTYPPGLGPDDYYRADFPSADNVRFSIDDLTASERAVGEAACGRIADIHLAAQCVFDVGITGANHWTEEYRAADRFLQIRTEPSTPTEPSTLTLHGTYEQGNDPWGLTGGRFDVAPMGVVVVRTSACPEEGWLYVLMGTDTHPDGGTIGSPCAVPGGGPSYAHPPEYPGEAYFWVPRGGGYTLKVMGYGLPHGFDVSVDLVVGPAPTVVEMDDLVAAGGHQHRLGGTGDATLYMLTRPDGLPPIDFTTTGMDVACTTFSQSHTESMALRCDHRDQVQFRGDLRSRPLFVFNRTREPVDISLTIDD